jgi:hypothetical protein
MKILCWTNIHLTLSYSPNRPQCIAYFNVLAQRIPNRIGIGISMFSCFPWKLFSTIHSQRANWGGASLVELPDSFNVQFSAGLRECWNQIQELLSYNIHLIPTPIKFCKLQSTIKWVIYRSPWSFRLINLVGSQTWRSN